MSEKMPPWGTLGTHIGYSGWVPTVVPWEMDEREDAIAAGAAACANLARRLERDFLRVQRGPRLVER